MYDYTDNNESQDEYFGKAIEIYEYRINELQRQIEFDKKISSIKREIDSIRMEIDLIKIKLQGRKLKWH